jgi:threonine dehydrogenase-like Zn-dependent dehydrogenase
VRTLYVDLSARRLVATRARGWLPRRWSREAYFGRLAPLQEADVPPLSLPGPRWVRVKNRLSGICGSDLHFVMAHGDLRIAPAALPGTAYRNYMGHEIVGDVVEVGPEVTTVQVGDRVVQHRSEGNCMGMGREPRCRFCAEGNYSLCEAIPPEGEPQGTGGGWSEEWTAPEGRLFKLPDDVKDEDAVLIEPAGSAVRAALRHRPQPGEKVMVIGCGTQGLFTVQSVRAVEPACEITALARFDYQAKMARKCGADHVIMLGSDTYAEVARLTGARVFKGFLGNKALLGGYDTVYDCVGLPNTLRDALRWARSRGTVIIVGVYLAPMNIDLTPVWYNEVDLKGVMAHGMEEWEGERLSTFDLIVRWIREGKLKMDGFITHRFPLSEYREAILTAIEQPRTSSIKVVFDMRDGSSEAS